VGVVSERVGGRWAVGPVLPCIFHSHSRLPPTTSWRSLANSPPQTLAEKDYQPDDLPTWNFDGSSTGQAPGDNSDVYLKPVAVFPDPFRGAPNILVLTECWDADGSPNKFNFRHEAAKIMQAHAAREPWFGLEQEYTLVSPSPIIPHL
jgi:glutamine synthetase